MDDKAKKTKETVSRRSFFTNLGKWSSIVVATAALGIPKASDSNEAPKPNLELSSNVLSERERRGVQDGWKPHMFPSITLPELKLDHLLALSDDVGLLQFAAFGIPDRDYGYSADDVGRGLAALMAYYNQAKSDEILPLTRTYMGFLKQAQTDTGHFHNFMSYDRRYLDRNGTDDTLGRVMCGLGAVVRWGPNQRFRDQAHDMMEKALPRLQQLEYPRGKAYSIVGFHHLLHRFPGASRFQRLLEKFADDLVASYNAHRTANWHWFEDTLTYGNAKLPEALFRAYQNNGKQQFYDVAVQALDFLTRTQWNGVCFELVGSKGWYPKDGKKATFGQQPIDAGYLVEAYLAAYHVTRMRSYLVHAEHAFQWFLGRNCAQRTRYDFADGSVADGIDSSGVSPNLGAESVVCFLTALINMSELKS